MAQVGEASFMARIRRTFMRFRPSRRGSDVREVLTGALLKLTQEELAFANEALSKRSTPKPGAILNLIGQFAAPKISNLVLFDPHPELVIAALDFKQVHIIEREESESRKPDPNIIKERDAIRKVLRTLLFRLNLNNVTVSGKYPERGDYNTIYVGSPFNKEAVRLLYVPSGALLIFQNIPFSEDTTEEQLTLEQKLSRNTFNSMVKAGYTCLYPPSTGSLSSSDFYILRKP